MRIIVLGGCGAMGSELTRDLAETSDFAEIVIADADLAKAQKLAAELGNGRVQAISVDVSDATTLPAVLRGFDVVANATTYHFGLTVTRAAIEARVNYLDLGGLFNTPRQLELNQAALDAGITICLGCGATPGVTNLCARTAANLLEQIDEVHIAFASFRSIAPSPGLLDTVLDEFSPDSRRFYWQTGNFIEVAAFSGARLIQFAPPVGELEVYYVPHSETHTLPRFLGKGIKLVDVRGSWRPEIMQALRLFAEYRLTGSEPIKFAGLEIKPKDFLRALILQQLPYDQGGWAFLLNVEVLGKREGRSVRCIFNTRHPDETEWGKAATAKMTGIPASIGAQMIARGEVERRGVLAPEACFTPATFFHELTRRDIYVDLLTEEIYNFQ
ncbi:MAG: saccharopine dehydrogenase NADP-binding domain-containing protein [Acidobacteriota bacterium]